MLSRNLENSAKELQPKEDSRMDHLLQHFKEGLLKLASVERTTYLRTVITSTSQNDQTIGNQVIRSKNRLMRSLRTVQDFEKPLSGTARIHQIKLYKRTQRQNQSLIPIQTPRT